MPSHTFRPTDGQDASAEEINAQAEIEREVRQSRKFTPQEALSRMAGPGALKGASPVTPVQQAETEVGNWLTSHLLGASELREVLHRQLKGSELLLGNLDRPLLALAHFFERVLDNEHRLEEVVREADVEWGRRMDERPYFDRRGAAENPGDPYTLRSVRATLTDLLKLLEPERS